MKKIIIILAIFAAFNFTLCSSKTKSKPVETKMILIGGQDHENVVNRFDLQSTSNGLQTSDGGYIIVGSTRSHDGDLNGNRNMETGGNKDVLLVKLDSDSKIVWTKTFGGKFDDTGISIIQTSDGGYALLATTRSNVGDSGYENHLRKDLNGNEQTTYASDVWLLKLSSSGAIEWNKCYGGSKDEEASGIKQTADGGFILAGYTKSGNNLDSQKASSDSHVNGNHPSISPIGKDDSGNDQYHFKKDAWVIKTNADGTLDPTFGSGTGQLCIGGSDDDSAVGVIIVSDGYVITGTTRSTDGDLASTTAQGKYDILVCKISSPGSTKTCYRYGGTGDEIGKNIIQDSTSLVLVGETTSNDGDFAGLLKGKVSAFIMKLDSAFAVSAKQTYGGSLINVAVNIVVDGSNYVFIGSTNSIDGDLSGLTSGGNGDLWIGVVDSQMLSYKAGTLIGGSQLDYGSAIIVLSNGYSVVGVTRSDLPGQHGSADILFSTINKLTK